MSGVLRSTSSPASNPRKANKACAPCRSRKIRCDAGEVGVPCSTCKTRKCADACHITERKVRTSRKSQALSSLTLTPRSSINRRQESHVETTPSIDRSSPNQTEPDLLYLQILNSDREEIIESRRDDAADHPVSSRLENLQLSRAVSAKPSKLNDFDREYLEKKGVFDVPPADRLDTFIRTYFQHVHPFAPVLDAAAFIASYKTGTYSLLLLHVVLATASRHAEPEFITDCGFADFSAAQEFFFLKAKLLHDFDVEDNLLSSLQASILLCMIVLDRPTNRDYDYWFTDAVRSATKLGLHTRAYPKDRACSLSKLHKRIWCTLYCLDSFHVSLDTKRPFLLIDILPKDLSGDDIFDATDTSEPYGLQPALTDAQATVLIFAREAARIFRTCLNALADEPQQDPEQTMQLFDEWRKSLLFRIQTSNGADIYSLSLQALGYRYGCILCQEIKRQSNNNQISFADQRLRSAMLELDTIIMRVVANESVHDYPVFVITIIPFVLALHIKTAVDPSESSLSRSMARNSINQGMLALQQGKDVPALKRALPIFTKIVERKKLFSTLGTAVDDGAEHSLPPGDNTVAGYDPSHTPIVTASHTGQWGPELFSDPEFLDLEFLNQWQQFE